VVAAGGRVIANGLGGDRPVLFAIGGGAGGAILLEAPTVTLASEAAVVANGGSGAAGGGSGVSVETSLDATPTPGGADLESGCQIHECTNGGRGGSGMVAPEDGDPAAGGVTTSGAGGGSYGYVRINTRDGTFSTASSAVISPSSTSALVRTR
jgi:hypothetical protein